MPQSATNARSASARVLGRCDSRKRSWADELGSTTPIVTYGLIALNVLVFVAQSASSSLERELTISPPAVAADGDLYRLITSAFLHYGITHLLFNMWALYVVGPPLEMWLGRLRFGALYCSAH